MELESRDLATGHSWATPRQWPFVCCHTALQSSAPCTAKQEAYADLQGPLPCDGVWGQGRLRCLPDLLMKVNSAFPEQCALEQFA